jgi:hypothetical protein
VSDRDVARERGQVVVGEDVGDEAHALVLTDVMAVADGDAGALLASMLDREEREVRLVGDLARLTVDADDSAHGR